MNNKTTEALKVFEIFLKALPHHDTVILRLNGVGETLYNTKQIHKGLEEYIKEKTECEK